MSALDLPSPLLDSAAMVWYRGHAVEVLKLTGERLVVGGGDPFGFYRLARESIQKSNAPFFEVKGVALVRFQKRSDLYVPKLEGCVVSVSSMGNKVWSVNAGTITEAIRTFQAEIAIRDNVNAR